MTKVFEYQSIFDVNKALRDFDEKEIEVESMSVDGGKFYLLTKEEKMEEDSNE